ncbi:MAG: glycosyltransferase [Deltaproteobacteria bacterium]|nr:glycosyltransferase [Deltaproteobacteria bacterium]
MSSWRHRQNMELMGASRPETAAALSFYPPRRMRGEDGLYFASTPEDGGAALPGPGFFGGPDFFQAAGRPDAGDVPPGVNFFGSMDGPPGACQNGADDASLRRDGAVLGTGPKGERYLRLYDGGRGHRLTSALNPRDEDRALVERFFSQNPEDLRELAVIGFGLGYHLEFIFARDQNVRVTLLEARPELFSAALAARDLGGLIENPRLTIILGPRTDPPADAPEAVLARPANLRLDGGLYPPAGRFARAGRPEPADAAPAEIMAAIKTPAGSPAEITAAWNSPAEITAPENSPAENNPAENNPAEKTGPEKRAPSPAPFKPPRVLFLDTSYFLTREIPRAAGALGAPVSVWKSRGGETADGEEYKRLLGQIKKFRPELVLTVNHLGFDAEGMLEDILRRLGVPAASWFVDSPAFILGAARKPSGDFFAFCWDRDYLPSLRELGYPLSHYLPLGSDERIFFTPPGSTPKNRGQLPGATGTGEIKPSPGGPPVSFVGDSLQAATGKYLALAGLPASSLEIIDGLAEKFLADDSLTPGPRLGGLADGLDSARLTNLQALVTWRASRIWRQKVLGAFPGGLLQINGDPGWAEAAPGIKLGPRLDYYRELSGHYRGSAVNLNITSAQMKTGLNQRVFDVPACGGFLLTDRRPQIDDMFEEGLEVVTYGTPGEAAEKAAWYLKNPGERQKIALAAQKRVLGEHLYRHRLARLLRLASGRND